MPIQDYFDDKARLIEERLHELMAHKPSRYEGVFDSASYSLFSGGKRIRPILTLAVTEALGGNIQAALDPACAIEMIHTSSLIHDDMPCMDDDDMRRGKPALHLAFPEWQALLTGDFLLTHAFQSLARAPHLDASQKVELIDLIARKTGAHGMVGGQLLDLKGSIKTLEELEELHNLKTGALLEASIEAGAFVAKASKEQMAALRIFSSRIGLAFQIADDILDFETDIADEKPTYVNFLGLEGSRKKAEGLLEESLCAIEIIGSPVLCEIARFIVTRAS